MGVSGVVEAIQELKSITISQPFEIVMDINIYS